MRFKSAKRYSLAIALATLSPLVLLAGLPAVHAVGTYSLYVLYPGYAQEGGTNALSLTVTGANATTYSFRFNVRDPQSKTVHSILYNYTNPAGQSQFNLPVVVYPSPGFQGPTNLVGTYNVTVDQIFPSVKTKVATNTFNIILTDFYIYIRTQTVNIRATGYNASESVNVAIRPVGSSTNVFSQNGRATAGGVVSTSWRIPWNATLGFYVVQVTGTSTVKNPADIQGILVGATPVTILSLTSSKSTYQRTETMQFSFQATYADNSNATTGSGIITLTRANGSKFNITATYDSSVKKFVSSYTTTTTDVTGAWNATMGVNWFDDSAGNTGPSSSVTTLPQLTAATLTVSANVTSFVGIGQSLRLNATMAYPDGSKLQSGSVVAYLVHSGSPVVNDTVSIIFDSGLQLWVGSYALQSTDPGGLWTLVIRASDSSTPSDTGSATKAVSTQDHPPTASFNPSATSVPTGTSLSFNATTSSDPDGTVTYWSWSFGDGTTDQGATVNHTYSTSGAYNVTLTVTDNSGSVASKSVLVTITDRAPTVSFTPSTTTSASGQTVTLSISASDPDGSVVATRVDWGDGTTPDMLSGSPTSDSHTYASSSTTKSYTITVTVTDNSQQTDTATSSVSVQAASGSSGGVLSLPLYYFGILAGLIGLLLVGGFVVFRRHKVTHARLKIDLEAVKSEAGRIESQDFFQNVKDQLKKEKDER